MVARLTRLKVPRFKSLSDFLLAQKYYFRALFMPGPAPDARPRLRRHRLFTEPEAKVPEFSLLQIPFKPPHKTHIRHTSDAAQPERD